MCWVQITKDERQKKQRACSQKRRLARKRRSSQAMTRISGRGRSIVRVSFPVLVNAVISIGLSFCLFAFAGAVCAEYNPPQHLLSIAWTEKTIHEKDDTEMKGRFMFLSSFWCIMEQAERKQHACAYLSSRTTTI